MKRILFVFLLINISWASPLDDFKQPLAMLNISVTGCTYKILLNDVPILQNDEGIPVAVDMPVNEWMLSKGNELSLQLGPVQDAEKLTQMGKSCKASVELAIRENGQPKSDGKVISKLSYQAPANQIMPLKAPTESSTAQGHYIQAGSKLTVFLETFIL